MALQYRYADKAMVSTHKKETAYDTVFPTYTAGNYTSLQEFTLAIGYDDERRVQGSGDGTEYGSNSFVTRQDIRMTLTIDNLRPNDMAWLSAYALGATAATQDPALTAYRHKQTQASLSQLPSFSISASEAGEQNAYTGCVIQTLTLSSDQGGYIQAVAEIIGSGRRTTDSQTYPATITEQPLLSNDVRIWMETADAIDIQTFPPVDGTSTLVAGAASSLVLTARVFGGWTVTYSNAHREAQGYIAPNTDNNLCRGELLRGAVRPITADLSGVSFESDEFEDYFLGTSNTQAHMALEINNRNTLAGVIADGGTFFFSGVIVIPRMTFDPMGSSGDDEGVITRDLKLTALNPTSAADGTDDVIQIYVQNTETAYMA